MNTLLYIDPGTGSMLFTIIIGAAGVVVFAVRKIFYKIKFILSGGRQAKVDSSKIPYLIFSEGKRYWNVFEPICDEFESRGKDLVYWTADPSDPALKKEYKHVKCDFIGEGNRAFVKLNMCNAGVILATTPGLDVYQWKRSKTVDKYVHVLHMPNDATLYRMFGIDYYDGILVSGQYQVDQIRKLEELRNLPAKEIEIVGQPYLDRLAVRLEKEGKAPEHNTTVLLAPSWGASGILSKYGEKIIDALISTGYDIIIRPHPQSFTAEKDLMDRLMAKYPDGEKVKWNRDRDNFDVLNLADILISDFSGVMFDYYLVFGKPIIYADTSFDKAPYDAAWIDEEPWTFASALPRMGKQLREEDFDHIKDVIDSLTGSSEFEAERLKICDETWAHRGESASLVVDYMTRPVEKPEDKKAEPKKKAKKKKA
ncbi:MAG: CDP-glycerol glycerophosphotransferase family protein [Clostridiales bacterium]|nr:CDP-glycerol glycerophosphotransferase family protein [Clostridiales bacterium]